MSILITGGMGFLGVNLAKQLLESKRRVVLFDIQPSSTAIDEIRQEVKIVRGDLAHWQDLAETSKNFQVESIFHLGAILSAAAEKDPMRAFEVNVVGTVNVLDTARLFGVEKVIFPSSVASYGPGVPEPVNEESRQEPRTVYGMSKVFGEFWGLYYYRRYGVDFRALRFPAVLGPGRSLAAAPAYTALMIQKPALGESYDVEVEERTRIPILYYKDAVRALMMLHDFKDPPSRIYNIAGFSPTALEIAEAVRKRIPSAEIRFRPKPEIVAIIESWPATMDDAKARRELGWELCYSLDRLVEDFIVEARAKAKIEL